MYIFKNAFLSIKRNKGRNILIGIIIMVISAASTIGLSIRNSANKIVKAYEEKYEVKATIGMNRSNLVSSFKEGDNTQEEMIENFNNIASLTEEEINNYGNSDYVNNYYYTYEISIDAKDLTEATDSLVKETTETKTENFPSMPGGFGGERKTTTTKTEEIKNMKAQNGAFTLTGYSTLESMTEFIEGAFTITEGEVSSDFESNSCIISEELALLNDLEVGDTITLKNPDNSKLTYELVITGIYTDNNDENTNMSKMFSSSANKIITNTTVVKNILEDDEDLNSTITPTYILINNEVADEFANEVTEKGLSEYYAVTNNLDEVSSATESITNVKSFATTFLIVTLIIGGVVLFVINMINIRERKYEIGVLRTIGMKKILVISQFLIELLVVAIISLALGAGIGASSSVKVANNLMQNEIENQTNNMDEINKNFGGEFNRMPDTKISGVTNINKIDSINAVVDFRVLMELLGIGMLLTIVSSVSASVAIARFSPLTILKERG